MKASRKAMGVGPRQNGNFNLLTKRFNKKHLYRIHNNVVLDVTRPTHRVVGGSLQHGLPANTLVAWRTCRTFVSNFFVPAETRPITNPTPVALLPVRTHAATFGAPGFLLGVFASPKLLGIPSAARTLLAAFGLLLMWAEALWFAYIAVILVFVMDALVSGGRHF